MATLAPIEWQTSDGLKVVFRSPRVGEGAEVLAVVREIMSRSEHLLTTVDELSYTEDEENSLIAAYAAHPDKLMIVPLIGNRIVGLLNFYPGSKKRIAHHGAFGMSLLPEFQGKGLGKRKLQALLDWAQANSRIECVRLRVHARNLPALRLYEKMGFAEEGRELKGIKFSNGEYDDVICMFKDVGFRA